MGSTGLYGDYAGHLIEIKEWNNMEHVMAMN